MRMSRIIWPSLPVWIYHTSSRYPINGALFRKILLKIKYGFWFIGAFTKLWKVNIIVVNSVRLSVRMEELCSHWTNFDETSYLVFFSKIRQQNWSFIKNLQIFEEFSNIKFHENPFSGNRDVPCGWVDGRTDGIKNGRTDRPEEANSRFWKFCKRA